MAARLERADEHIDEGANEWTQPSDEDENDEPDKHPEELYGRHVWSKHMWSNSRAAAGEAHTLVCPTLYNSSQQCHQPQFHEAFKSWDGLGHNIQSGFRVSPINIRVRVTCMLTSYYTPVVTSNWDPATLTRISVFFVLQFVVSRHLVVIKARLVPNSLNVCYEQRCRIECHK